MREKKNAKTFRLPVNNGLRTDSFSEDVPLLDINNYVLLPDGSGIVPRPGLEVRRNDGVGYGSDGKLIYFISDPPDIDYGDMIAILNTKNGRHFIEATEVVRTTNTVAPENPMPMPELPAEVDDFVHFSVASRDVPFNSEFETNVVGGGTGGTTGWEAVLIVDYTSPVYGTDYTSPYGDGEVTATEEEDGIITLTAPAEINNAAQRIEISLIPPTTEGVTILNPDVCVVNVVQGPD